MFLAWIFVTFAFRTLQVHAFSLEARLLSVYTKSQVEPEYGAKKQAFMQVRIR